MNIDKSTKGLIESFLSIGYTLASVWEDAELDSVDGKFPVADMNFEELIFSLDEYFNSDQTIEFDEDPTEDDEEIKGLKEEMTKLVEEQKLAIASFGETHPVITELGYDIDEIKYRIELRTRLLV